MASGNVQHQENGGGGNFQDDFAAALMTTEELRQKLNTPQSQQQAPKPLRAEQVLSIRHRMEDMMGQLYSLNPSDDVEADLRKHCHQKASGVALSALQYVITKEEKDPEESDTELERDCQGAIARIAELNLVLHQDSKDTVKLIIETYTSYQRKVLRLRSKPSIARLVAFRQQESPIIGEEEDDDEESAKTQHAHVITTILAQASALVHPLIMWKSGLPEDLIDLNLLCTESIKTLDGQAQSLTQTVAGWCFEDRKIDEWMTKSANETQCLNDTSELDTLVDELAFCCQVFARYIELLDNSSTETIIKDLHPEWTWKYASLERYLTTQQTLLALQMAKPVQIVLGTAIQVPSVVEDAQFLSTRALDRAASTRSTQAIGTVAHSIANDVWSKEITTGVYHALVEHKGCWEEPAVLEPTSPTRAAPGAPSSNSFAQALMGALDEDLNTNEQSMSSPPRSNRNAVPQPPSSGSILGSISSSLGGGEKMQQIRLDIYFCALNGMHSASVACSSLVSFLDSLLPTEDDESAKQVSPMTQLAREELFQYSGDYQHMMREQASRVVNEFGGYVTDAAVYKGSHYIPVLRYYLEREDYELANAEDLQKAEDDARLHKFIVVPFEESRLLKQFNKCDADVLKTICEEIVIVLVDLFLDCIFSQTITKRFTDWGSLLLSKQVRTIKNYISGLMESSSEHAIPTLPQWERLSQVVTILQLEKPSDWSYYRGSSTLTRDEVERTMRLRVDFSPDVIASVVSTIKS
ncbi:unnamed protein product [Cylindrotheca closterium]|uniref:Uncharacterized protein n=1 Tax=Cylindrotheca closterium TaxID=2856 RepID=A0AAD2CNH2_9STRA|nr:unnamed protein product [Cylindrotheca closterium]